MTVEEKYAAALQLIRDINLINEDRAISKLLKRFSEEVL